MTEIAAHADFHALDLRVGTITDAKRDPVGGLPSLRLWVDFGGEIGSKTALAGLAVHYKVDQLIGRQVVGVVNLPSTQSGDFNSEVRLLGLPDENGDPILIRPDFRVPDGGRVS